MIVADTSAFAAVIFRETDADRYAKMLAESATVLVPAPSAFELRLILYRRYGRSAMSLADPLLTAPSVRIVEWNEIHMPLAMDALARFGGSPARLNFGDCLTYAVAKVLDAPLLYKGEDFARTDIRSAL